MPKSEKFTSLFTTSLGTLTLTSVPSGVTILTSPLSLITIWLVVASVLPSTTLEVVSSVTSVVAVVGAVVVSVVGTTGAAVVVSVVETVVVSEVDSDVEIVVVSEVDSEVETVVVSVVDSVEPPATIILAFKPTVASLPSTV